VRPARFATQLLRVAVVSSTTVMMLETANTAGRADDASRFPRTAWSMVLRAKTGREREESRIALDELCRSYWKPLAGYVAALGCNPGDVEDVVQDFLGAFLRRDGFQKAEPERGRLRAYLKSAIRNHLHHWWRDRAAQKRGSGGVAVSIEEVDISEPDGADAAGHFDREWALSMLDAAISELRAGYESRGRLALFETLKPCLLGDPAERMAGLAAQAGITPGALAVEVHRARKRLADALRERVAQTVDDEAEVHGELMHLLRCIAEQT